MTSRWGSPLVRRAYADRQGWSDAGERLAFVDLLPLPPGARVLDIGIGGGRTTGLLRPGSSSYIGIDSSPEMVRLARSRYPDADLRLGDARDLSAFPDAGAELVVFSLNGLDCLAHDERTSFLRSAHRVLALGGALVFSTHNLDGPSYLERPAFDLTEVRSRSGVLSVVKGVVGGLVRLVLGHWNYRHTRTQAEQHQGWALAPLRAHEFRFVVHFVRLSAALALLERCGFLVEGAWTDSGVPIGLDQQRHGEHYSHLVCRARS